MRHEQLSDKDSFTKVDIAAVWPVAPQMAPVPIPDADQARSPAAGWGLPPPLTSPLR